MFTEEEVVILGKYLRPFKKDLGCFIGKHSMLYELCSVYVCSYIRPKRDVKGIRTRRRRFRRKKVINVVRFTPLTTQTNQIQDQNWYRG